MAEKKINQLRNLPKDSADEKAEKSSRPEKKERSTGKKNESAPASEKRPNPFSGFSSFVRENERFHRISGAFLLFIVTPCLATAFTSYLFTWENDQNKVMDAWNTLFSPEIKVENLLGKFGALISHLFMYKWFGIASFGFVFLSFISGLRILFNVEIFETWRTFRITSFLIVFVSVTLGFVFSSAAFVPGGVFGYQTVIMLNGLLGSIGTGFLLLFSLLVL